VHFLEFHKGMLALRADVLPEKALLSVEKWFDDIVEGFFESPGCKEELICRIRSSLSDGPVQLGFLVEAWSRRYTPVKPDLKQTDIRMPRFPACACWYDQDSARFHSRKLNANGIGCERKLNNKGSHAFVLVVGESHLRVCLTAHVFGEAMGHIQLAQEEPIVFAGEIEVDDEDRLTRWNNVSGTYQCPSWLAFQVN